MATVAKGIINSSRGSLYEVFLDNGAPDAGGLLMDVKAGSGRTEWKLDTDDVDGHVLASKASVEFAVTSDPQKAIFTGMVEANELQYRLRIHKDGALYWVGFVLLDIVSADFSGYPYFFKVAATDGLSRLKDIDYEQGDLTEFVTIDEHIINILSNIPLGDYFGAGDRYLSTHSTAWPDGLTPSTSLNQLTRVRLGFKALRTVDAQGVITSRTAYEALNEILTLLGSRLAFSQGRYILSETLDYARQLAPVTFHHFNISGSALASETLTNWLPQTVAIGPDLTSSPAVALTSGRISYFPPLKGVDLTYKHYSRQNLLPGLVWNQGRQVFESLENFRTNGGAGRLLISANLSFDVEYDDPIDGTPGADELAFVEFSIAIRIIDPDDDTTGNSLQRLITYTPSGISYTDASWSDATSSTFQIAFPVPATGQTGSFPVVIASPIVPREGTLQVAFRQSGTEVVTGSGNTYPADIGFDVANFFIESLVSGSIVDQYNYTNFAPVTAAAGANSIIFEREMLFGDGPDENTFGRVEYSPDGTEWLIADGWRRWGNNAYLNATSMPLGGLVAQSILALQATRKEVLNLTVVAPSYAAHFLFSCGDATYLMQSGSLSMDDDRWRGRWFESGINFIDAVPPVQDTNVPPIGDTGVGTGDTPQLPGSNPGGTPPGATGGNATPGLSAPGINTVLTATDSGIVADTEIGGLTVPDLTNTPLFAGDILTIIDPITGQTITVTVSHDSGYIPGLETDPGAVPYYGPDGIEWLVPSTTEVAINPVTPTTGFPEGSYIQPNSEFTAQLQALLRRDYYDMQIFGYDTSLATGFVGQFWRPARRIGWHIRKVHFAFGQDLTGSAKVNLKYYDATGFRYTVATYNGGGLGGVVDAFADVLAGYFRVEVETITGTAPKGLTVIIEMIKINV